EDDVIAAQVKKLEDTKTANTTTSQPAAPAKPDISYDDFQNMDLRICQVLEAEKVAKTKKLLKLKVDTGIDKREIISGIADYYEPEVLIGKKVLMLINLAPKEIKGTLSHGMILMAENCDGTLALVQPEKEIANGGTVK
ncbi:MAG: methionine--tRNA ligase subunit beta, partial [Bacteroidales bacterium]|nr:methionine--tRNA ligase subunit beta [Bacteroidales bacterium]